MDLGPKDETAPSEETLYQALWVKRAGPERSDHMGVAILQPRRSLSRCRPRSDQEV